MSKKAFDIYCPYDCTIHYIGPESEIRNGTEYKSKYGLRVYAELQTNLFPDMVMLFAHLSEVIVEEGQYVYKGQKIGTMGNTGMNPQTVIPLDVMDEIFTIDNDLWYDIFSYSKTVSVLNNPIVITDEMRADKEFMHRLNDWLDKHLHFSLFPDVDLLRGKYAEDPRELLKTGYPVTNTKQSGAWHEDYSHIYGYHYLHGGVDFSGLQSNLIDGWEHDCDVFFKEFRRCIV